MEHRRATARRPAVGTALDQHEGHVRVARTDAVGLHAHGARHGSRARPRERRVGSGRLRQWPADRKSEHQYGGGCAGVRTVSRHRRTLAGTDAMKEQETNAGAERLRRVVAVASLAFSLFYITWRWAFTINTEALWYSVPLALAETYGLLTAFFLTFTAWAIRLRTPPAPLRDRTVDVFVTTYDEPLAIIRKTALAARELHYPHTTYLLDDGHREDVRLLAGELNVRYLRRDNRVYAKAGNLNNALRHSTGEFILQLDADHVPPPNMIDRPLGYVDDERVAVVLEAQDLHNTDAFTYDIDEGARRIWEDQQLFFRVLQPGKDRLNAAFFVGSCAVLRRRALEEIGGFATGTVTEDIETSLLLHRQGWRSVYLNETLAYGLAPSNARAFHVQHLRWGQGAMQVIRQYRPMQMRGLTIAQRIAYLDSLTTY